MVPGTSPLSTDFETIRQVNKGHGRLEARELTISSLLQGYRPWPGLVQVFRIVSRTPILRSGMVRECVRYGVTSLPRA